MASEDSDELMSGLAVVHRLSDANDLQETVTTRVTSGLDHRHARRELLEVISLRRSKRMLAEERNDRLHEIRASAHDVLAQVLSVVVVPPVHEDAPHPEESLKLFEAVRASDALRHYEPVAHLIAGRVAFPLRTVCLPHETDGEASFSVYETDHPATQLDQPFLLVFRTRHVVTMVDTASDIYEVVRDTRVFQHIARCAPCRCRHGGQRLPK